MKLRWYRPYPTDEIRRVLKNVSNVGIIERNFAMGALDNGAITMHDLQSAMYDAEIHPRIVDFMVGLGDREISNVEVRKMFEMTANRSSPKVSWIGLRE
ncbi:MAG: hypothetical protein QXQ46_08115 [Thermoplasmatales archaeon]